MQDLKIPFGFDKNSGSIKEVGDVSRGRDCGCVCPSCRQGLIARQGDVLVWHFSHDKDAEDRPVRECDISFESCCRLYTIDLAVSGAIPGLRTPARAVMVHGIRRVVCESKSLPEFVFQISTRYDIEVLLPSASIGIFLSYSGRALPPLPADPRQGLLAIDIEHIKNQYARTQSGPGVLRAIISDVFIGDSSAKSWLYHPREQVVIAEAPPPKANPPLPAPAIRRPRPSSALPSYKPPRSVPSYKPPAPAPNRLGQFLCLGCGHVWSGRENDDRLCKGCGSHLLSRFTAHDARD